MNRLPLITPLLFFSQVALASDPSGLVDFISGAAVAATIVLAVIAWALTRNLGTLTKSFARIFVVILIWGPTFGSDSYYPAFWVYIIPDQGNALWTFFSTLSFSFLASIGVVFAVRVINKPAEPPVYN
jgi:hypothetical protein